MARIKSMARALKASGAGGGMDLLSAQVYLGLLLGTLPCIPPAEDAPPDPPGDPFDDHPGGGPGGPGGSGEGPGGPEDHVPPPADADAPRDEDCPCPDDGPPGPAASCQDDDDDGRPAGDWPPSPGPGTDRRPAECSICPCRGGPWPESLQSQGGWAGSGRSPPFRLAGSPSWHHVIRPPNGGSS